MAALECGSRMQSYDPEGFFDEMVEKTGEARKGMEILVDKISQLDLKELSTRQQEAERAFFNAGITFNVYGDSHGTEKIFPFDIIPRMVTATEWATIEQGLKQRIFALNLFIHDVYHDRRIIRDGIVPEYVVESASAFRPECLGLSPPHKIWCHITGSDLIRDRDGQFYVLEDNMRCPSGVSYVLENREVMKRSLPHIFEAGRVSPVEEYPSKLIDTLQYLAPESLARPEVAVLTPGAYNSAYFEHSFLARQMGVELVEGRDLVVIDGYVKMRTTRGFERVDVIYRRVDDDFLDPKAFRTDSMLGVPGLMAAYRAGKVALANAPGTGVADDKVVYAYVPRIIKYYLGEEPIIPNVETYLCCEEKSRQHVLQNLDKLVVKAANESGGYGMLVGPHSTKAQQEEFRHRIEANPRNYIAQPTLALSRAPTLCGDSIEGRHVDLRPYVLYGKDIYVMPGGLTRVALRKGSLVVNSSQGGGSKDTWVLAGENGSRNGAAHIGGTYPC